MSYTYAKAGVNVRKVEGIQNKIASILSGTLNKNVLLGAGHYAGIVQLKGIRLAMHADGVGSKVLIAQLLNKYDTVGIDAIAMNVNDLICLGARPFAAVDYLAIVRSDERIISEIMKGLKQGARLSDCAIIGGETAIVPDLIKGLPGKGFDLSVTCIGELEGKPITGEDMKEGDLIIGLESSGLHSNGYTLARKVLLRGENANNRGLLKQLLIPTRIYSTAVMEVIKKIKTVHGLAHITGGAFSKLQRLSNDNKKGFLLNDMPTIPAIFKRIQKEANLSQKEMYRTFNMGIGFCIIVAKKDAKAVQKICKKHRIKSHIIGRIIDEPGVYLQTSKGTIILS